MQGLEIVLAIALAFAGAVFGAAVMHIAQRARVRDLISERERLREKVQTAEQDRLSLAGTQMELAKEREAHQEKIHELTKIRENIEKEFGHLVQNLLLGTKDSFLKESKEVFEEQQKQSREGIHSLVAPIEEQLAKYQTGLVDIEKERSEAQGKIQEQIQNMLKAAGELRETTGNLASVLRNQPSARGRWGEQQLRRVLEMAGMVEGADFETQAQVPGELGGALRPDVVLKMPGERILVIDAKVPMTAYLKADAADNEKDRKELLIEHANRMRDHAKRLGSKEYWKQFENTPEFVLMYVPGDSLHAVALSVAPDLFEEAFSRGVIIVSPGTLLALAKTIAYGWRQEKASKNAREVLAIGEDIFERFRKVSSLMSDVGKALSQAVNAQNTLIGSYEGRLIPKVRQLQEAGVGARELGEVGEIEHSVRAMRSYENEEDGEESR